MIDIDKTCGLCKYWKPGESGSAGSLTYHTQDPACTFVKAKKPKIKYAEDKPCWGWKEADPWELVIRKRAGLIDGDVE